MIDCPPTRIWRRVLGLAVCYVLALQAFFAAFERAVALSQANATDGALVICHSRPAALESRKSSRACSARPDDMRRIFSSSCGVIIDTGHGLVGRVCGSHAFGS